MQYNNITKDMENILKNELKQKQLIAYVGLFTIILQLIIIIQLLTNGV